MDECGRAGAGLTVPGPPARVSRATSPFYFSRQRSREKGAARGGIPDEFTSAASPLSVCPVVADPACKRRSRLGELRRKSKASASSLKGKTVVGKFYKGIADQTI